MWDFIERGLLIRRELQEDPKLTEKYRAASLTPGEWKNLGQIGDPMGLVAKNETVVGLKGGIEAMVSLVHKLHEKPLGRINPDSAQYQRTGLQMTTDWIGYFPHDVSADAHVRYYDSTGIRNSGSRVEILSVATDPERDSVRIIVLKPSPEETIIDSPFFVRQLGSGEQREWDQWEFKLKEGATKDDEVKAFMLAIKGNPAENRIKQAIADGGIPFLYREPADHYEPGKSYYKAYHFGVVPRKPDPEQLVLTGRWPNNNIMEIGISRSEAQTMFQRLVIPK